MAAWPRLLFKTPPPLPSVCLFLITLTTQQLLKPPSPFSHLLTYTALVALRFFAL